MHSPIAPPRLVLVGLCSVLCVACVGSSGDEQDAGVADSGAEAGDESPPACPMDEMFATEQVEPLFACVDEAGPCAAIDAVFDYTLGGGFAASIAGSEAAAECWYEQLGAGATGRYRLDKDFFGDPGYNTYDVFAGRLVEWRQVDLPEGSVEVRRGPRNLASSDYWLTCRSQWDGGEFLPDCFWAGFADCTVWATEDQACGDDPGVETGEDPPIDEPIEWPDGGQYSGPCSSIGECVGFGGGQAITCVAQTHTCTTGCFDVSECDPAPNGDAVPVCVGGGISACHLDCSSGQTCPSGMVCAAGLCGW